MIQCRRTNSASVGKIPAGCSKPQGCTPGAFFICIFKQSKLINSTITILLLLKLINGFSMMLTLIIMLASSVVIILVLQKLINWCSVMITFIFTLTSVGSKIINGIIISCIIITCMIMRIKSIVGCPPSQSFIPPCWRTRGAFV